MVVCSFCVHRTSCRTTLGRFTIVSLCSIEGGSHSFQEFVSVGGKLKMVVIVERVVFFVSLNCVIFPSYFQKMSSYLILLLRYLFIDQHQNCHLYVYHTARPV